MSCAETSEGCGFAILLRNSLTSTLSLQGVVDVCVADCGRTSAWRTSANDPTCWRLMSSWATAWRLRHRASAPCSALAVALRYSCAGINQLFLHMTCVAQSLAVRIVAGALLIRRQHPCFPALDLLDKVMGQWRGQHIDFGDLAVPPAPFATLIAEALDGGMQASDWEGLWRCNEKPEIRAILLKLWMLEVWPKFRNRYNLH